MLTVTLVTAVLSIAMAFVVGTIVGGFVVERHQRRLLLQLNAQWLLVSTAASSSEPTVLMESKEGSN